MNVIKLDPMIDPGKDVQPTAQSETCDASETLSAINSPRCEF